MYGLEEINLEPGKSVPAGRSSDAEARAKAFAAGCRWQCKRVKAWVNAEECVARYIAAKGSPQTYCPCLECGSVRTQLKGMVKPLEGVSHVQQGRGGPVTSAPAPRPAPMPQKPIAEIVKQKKQGEKAMSRPAKKRTEDPIMSEVKAAVAPVLEVLKQEITPARTDAADPFSEWEKYDTLLGRRQRKLAFVRMTHKAIYFSTRCVENLRLSDYTSLDVLVAPDLSGLAFRFHKDDAGTFTLSKRIKDKTELKISAAGLVRFYEGLRPHLEKKLEPIVHGPGRISILFAKEVEA